MSQITRRRGLCRISRGVSRKIAGGFRAHKQSRGSYSLRNCPFVLIPPPLALRDLLYRLRLPVASSLLVACFDLERYYCVCFVKFDCCASSFFDCFFSCDFFLVVFIYLLLSGQTFFFHIPLLFNGGSRLTAVVLYKQHVSATAERYGFTQFSEFSYEMLVRA